MNKISFGSVHFGAFCDKDGNDLDVCSTDILENSEFKESITFVKPKGTDEHLRYLDRNSETEYGTLLLKYTQAKYDMGDMIGIKVFPPNHS